MKRPYINANQSAAVLALALALAALVSALSPPALASSLFILTALILSGLGLLGLELLLRLARLRMAAERGERAMQTIHGIYRQLDPPRPLPPLGGVALPVEAAASYLRSIENLRPSTIVELGGGASTLLAALALKRIGSGRVIALDEDESWAELTRQWLTEHGAENFGEVRYAARSDVKLKGKRTAQWYDPIQLDDVATIDLLLIDGPVDLVDGAHRSAALELLGDRLSESAIIYADDGHRRRWRRDLEGWAAEHGWSVRPLHFCESHTLLMERKP